MLDIPPHKRSDRNGWLANSERRLAG